MKSLRFIDLFAGLGGFHLAMSRLGHRAVFASELNEELRSLYERNFGLRAAGDIREVAPRDIPAHDILCAGFPCQPFSKAGDQQGFSCPRWGDLFDYVLDIVAQHHPRFLLLENVPNLERHDQGRSWRRIRRTLKEQGYDIRWRRLSPHHFGIPQIRERLFIVGSLEPLDGFTWPAQTDTHSGSLLSVLDHNPSDAKRISAQTAACLDVWQQFIQAFPRDRELPWFPIWSMEFGATYPYERTTPFRVGPYRLRPFTGSHGLPLAQVAPADRFSALPSYARTQQFEFPRWKINFIRANRELYAANRKWIDPWLSELRVFPPSLQKLEWNCKGGERDIWRYIIQFRASGVRVKRPVHAPSLIAMNATQVPIVAWEKRYMTPWECARLQSMGDIPSLPELPLHAYRALGNAVNVDVVALVADSLLRPAKFRSKAVA